jgi:TldD protein
VRVLYEGGWGFSATQELTQEGVERCAALAVEIARASARVQREPIHLLPEPSAVAEWSSPCKIDPFAVSIEENFELLRKIDATLAAVEGVTLAETSMIFRRYEQWFYNSEGAAIHQTRTTTGAGFAAHAFEGDSIQARSYPNSFGGQYQNKGYELIDELHLLENAERVARECVALLKAPQCPEGRRDLVLDSSQLGLQIHESIGHPIELDRVLGYEANFAGTSFLTLDRLHKLRYGSDLVNVVADARPEHGPGLGTFAYDDEGVAAQCVPIITHGQFEGYLSSRDTAAMIGRARSGGHMRAEGWARVPIVRMSNVSILPGEKPLSFDELISSTDDGIYMQTNRSWSIDDKRFNFQFGCEAAWEIKGGKLGRMLRNPSYSGITTEFWNSMDAICDHREWTLWGTPNCGKGQPEQGMGTGHGAAPARFKQVKLGGAYGA